MNTLDQRDPLAVFGVEATNALVAQLERLDVPERRRALEDELNSIDVSLFPALNKRVGRMLLNESGLTDLAAIREAMIPIFANYAKNVFTKAYHGDVSALSGCGCGGPSAVGDIFGTITGAIGQVGSTVKNLLCKVAPTAAGVPNPYVAGGALVANQMCGSSAGGGLTAEQIAMLQAQAAEQARRDQQRNLLIAGGIAAILVVVVATRN